MLNPLSQLAVVDYRRLDVGAHGTNGGNSAEGPEETPSSSKVK